MDRRSLLGRAAAVACLPVLPASLRAASTSEIAPIRRVRRSDPLWPSSADWERLNQEVGGRLIKVQSPFSACESALESAPCRDVAIQVQGGGCATVGVAGLIHSGGFGSFSKNYGMAAAGLLEAEIVTADGAVRTVNACSDPDLLWAIKGGGGGSLGVLTKLTLRTRELPVWFGAAFLTVKAASDAAFRRLIGQYIDFYSARLCNPHWGESVTLRPDNTLAVSMVSQGLDSAQAAAVWQPFLEWIAGSPQDLSYASAPRIGSIPAQNWWAAD